MRLERKSGISRGSPLQLPPDADEASKFVREAVRAHPEIYFARHAIFGEGASEEIVLPRLAEALGVPVDRSFVAIVPIGGRHIEHFWRLVRQLGISHTTLLDLDLGRSSGDIVQIKTIAKALMELGAPASEGDRENLRTASGLARRGPWDTAGGWNQNLLDGWTKFLEQHGIFFSSPLDLDLLMLEAFPSAVRRCRPERGVHKGLAIRPGRRRPPAGSWVKTGSALSPTKALRLLRSAPGTRICFSAVVANPPFISARLHALPITNSRQSALLSSDA